MDAAAEKRKRRKEIIQSQRAEGEKQEQQQQQQQALAAATAVSEVSTQQVPAGVTATTNGTVSGVAAASGTDKASVPTPNTDEQGTVPVAATTTTATSTNNEKKPPKKRKVGNNNYDDEGAKKKTQIRYDPEVPMSKEQLAAWRREARRVRNRESAAASRQRIRNRISELEDEVGQWKERYSHAMERLQSLEDSIASDPTAAATAAAAMNNN